MELDDLKKIWQETARKDDPNLKIMELIQNRNDSPLESLKASYRKQIIVMSVIPVLLILSNFNDIDKVLTSILFWAYVVFCTGISLLARMNYAIVVKMQSMNTMVKAHLEQHIMLLEKSVKLELIGLRCVLLFFVLLVEIIPFFQQYRMLDKWNSLDVSIRIGAYAFLVGLQYVLSRKMKEKKVGRHLENLKQLVNQMN